MMTVAGGFPLLCPRHTPVERRHYHVKVQKPRGRILTTQLYFPNERLNEQDSLFDRRLVMRVSSSDEGRFGRFDFVV